MNSLRPLCLSLPSYNIFFIIHKRSHISLSLRRHDDYSLFIHSYKVLVKPLTFMQQFLHLVYWVVYGEGPHIVFCKI